MDNHGNGTESSGPESYSYHREMGDGKDYRQHNFARTDMCYRSVKHQGDTRLRPYVHCNACRVSECIRCKNPVSIHVMGTVLRSGCYMSFQF